MPSYLHLQPATEGYCAPGEVVRLRIFHDGHRWNLDGVAEDGRYTNACWVLDSHAACVTAMPVFMRDNGISFGSSETLAPLESFL